VADASTNPKFTEQGYDNVFRTIGRDDQQGPFAAKLIATHLHAKTAAVIHDNTTYAKGLAEQTVTTLKQLGVNVVYFNSIVPGEKDYTSVLTRVKSLNPDVVYYTGYFAETGILVKQAKQLGMKAIFMGGDASSDPTLLKTAGDAANGMIITTAPLAQFISGAQDFVQKYKSAYNTGPGPFSVYEYDAVQVVAQAIKNAGSTDPKKIDQALHGIKGYQGLTGDITFDSKGDRKGQLYMSVIVKNGEFKPYMKLDSNGQWVSAAQQ
jgi:ABC-type branched-subunit amino acid transport system substrate-binding protein